MGGKRPDQHNIDPAEAGATDYKNLPQTGRGHSNLDDTIELDKQRHAQADREARDASHPGSRPAPSRDANEGREREIRDDTGAASTKPDKRNSPV